MGGSPVKRSPLLQRGSACDHRNAVQQQDKECHRVLQIIGGQSLHIAGSGCTTWCMACGQCTVHSGKDTQLATTTIWLPSRECTQHHQQA
jgi:hypothetical protein